MQHSNGVRMDETLAARYDFEQYLPQNSASARRTESIYLVGYEERQKHYQPISFGLSVSYPLMSNLSLSTGITYTRLRSDFASIINGSSISQEQTLHYLGFPLNVQYRLFHRGGLNIYLSGVKYYFDNGSRLHNFFKNKPTSFNLQVGLRLIIISNE